jgi:hypothetical protein
MTAQVSSETLSGRTTLLAPRSALAKRQLDVDRPDLGQEPGRENFTGTRQHTASPLELFWRGASTNRGSTASIAKLLSHTFALARELTREMRRTLLCRGSASAQSSSTPRAGTSTPAANPAHPFLVQGLTDLHIWNNGDCVP